MSSEYKKHLCENCGKGYDPAYSFISDPEDAQLFVNVFGEEIEVCGQCAEDMVEEVKDGVVYILPEGSNVGTPIYLDQVMINRDWLVENNMIWEDSSI